MFFQELRLTVIISHQYFNNWLIACLGSGHQSEDIPLVKVQHFNGHTFQHYTAMNLDR